MAINLFGFTIGREDKQQELKSQSFITPVAEDGASTVSAGGYYGTYGISCYHCRIIAFIFL